MNIIQNADGSLGLGGTDGTAGEFTFDARSYNASSLSSASFIASRPYRVKSIIGRVEVAGTDASAVTAALFITPSGTALASGLAAHSGTFNLKGTAATNQVLALSANTLIPTGSCIGVVYTGVLTSAAGTITIALCPT